MDFRRYQSGKPTVFSGAYIITVLQYVYMWRIWQLCGRFGLTAPGTFGNSVPWAQFCAQHLAPRSLTAPKKNSLAYAVAVEGKYPYLYDKATKNWTDSKTVRNVFVQGNGAQPGNTGVGRVPTNSWMNGGKGHGNIPG